LGVRDSREFPGIPEREFPVALDDIVHAVLNTIDSCINSATDLRGYVLERS